MASYERHQIGQAGEMAACLYLKKQGLQLLTQNYHCYAGEIDLVMQDGDDIVFVEVRTRHHLHFGNALESIHVRKMKRLIKTGKHFLQMKKWLYQVNSRFDIIVIHPVNGQMTLEWIKNAFTVDNEL